MKKNLYYFLRLIWFVLILYILDTYKQTFGWVSLVVCTIILIIGDDLIIKFFKK